jgi:hypothetical protein
MYRPISLGIVLLVASFACNGDPEAEDEIRPRRRSYYVSRLVPDVVEGMPIAEALDRLSHQGFRCDLRELPRITCCSSTRIIDRFYICNRPDGPSLAQLIFRNEAGRVHELSGAGSLGIGGPDWRRDVPLRFPSEPPGS